MRTNLYGEVVSSYADYAHPILASLAEQPMHEVKILPDYITPRLFVQYPNLGKSPSVPGFYQIFLKESFFEPTLLYVGRGNFIHARIRRFFGELTGITHPDEFHCGGMKYRKDRGRFEDDHLIRYIEEVHLPFVVPVEFHERVDDCMAYIAKAKYNGRKIQDD